MPSGKDGAEKGPYLPRLWLFRTRDKRRGPGATHGRGADVAMSCEKMSCENCESASQMTLVLSPEEAKALGLHALRDRPGRP
jgi:hypothetical protein